MSTEANPEPEVPAAVEPTPEPVQQALPVEPILAAEPEVAPEPAAEPEPPKLSAAERVRQDPEMRVYLAEQKAKAQAAAEDQLKSEMAEETKRAKMDAQTRLELERDEAKAATKAAKEKLAIAERKTELMTSLNEAGIQLRPDPDLVDLANTAIARKMEGGADMATAIAELQAEKDFLFRAVPSAAPTSSQPAQAKAPTAPAAITQPGKISALKMNPQQWAAARAEQGIPG